MKRSQTKLPVPARSLALDLPAAHNYGRMGRQIARTFAKLDGLGEAEVEDLTLVIAELLSNCVDHGGGRGALDERDLLPDVRMRLELEFFDDAWHVRVTDQGGGDPEEIRGYIDNEIKVDPENERGRGFFLLRQMVDELTVERSSDRRGLTISVHKKIQRRPRRRRH